MAAPKTSLNPVAAQMDSMLPKKGMSYGKLILDNILGLDNEYESFGEKLGKAINEDEVGFLKDASVGAYEGAKELITNPIQTTKKVFSEIKDGVQRLGSENLNTRLNNMYGVSYADATDDQVNSAKEAVFGDAITALSLVPAAKATVSVAKAGIKNTNIDKVMTLGETEGSTFKGKLNLVHGFNPPTNAPNLVPTFTASEKYGGERYGELDGAETPGGSYGATGVYLENPSEPLFFNSPEMQGFYAPKTAQVSAQFNKAFILRPDTLKELGQITGINLKDSLPKIEDGNLKEKNYLAEEQGALVSAKLKELGYDGLIVKDFFLGDKEIDVYDKYEPLRKKIEAKYKEKFGKPIPEKGTKEHQQIINLYNKQNKELEKIYSQAGIHPLLTQPQIIHLKPETLSTEKVFPESLQSNPSQVSDLQGTQPIRGEKTPGYLERTLNKLPEYDPNTLGSMGGNINLTPKAADSSNGLKDYAYRTDNPATKGYEGGEEWLEGKQKTAEDRAKNSSKENSTGKLLSGSITGYMGQDFERPLFLSTEMLSKLKGANDEKRYVGEGRYDLLRKRVDKEGFDPEQKYSSEDDYGNAIVIGVNHKGEAFIIEGNTRVAVAKDLDVPSIRAEVKYYNGAEEVDGPYSPQEIIQYADKPKDFNKGGAVMNKQMEMAFMQQGGLKDDGMRQDPVSGNQVPSGSMASEVRDDIPAQLSEGEYVVPADVVRFFGVKFFEDLRSEAKMGLQSMEANGRIGGEPVPMETGELSDEEFARLLQQELGGTLTTQNAEPIKAAGGTYVPGQMSSFNPDNYGLGFSLTPGYTPPAAVGTEPVVETEASCAAKGMVLGPDGVCIVAPQAKNDNDNDGPIVPAPAAGEGQGLGGAWYKGDEDQLLNDPEAYITDQLGRGEMLDSGLAKAATMLLPGGIVLAAGNKFADTEGIARARAALMIAKARGTLSAEKIKSLEDAISKDAQGNFIVDKDGKGLGIGTGINYANSFAKSFGFNTLEEAASEQNKNNFNNMLKLRAKGTRIDFSKTSSKAWTGKSKEERQAAIDKANKDARKKLKASQASRNDKGISAADAMRDRQDRMSKIDAVAKEKGKGGNFGAGSVTGSAVYAGGNRAEGGLMLKKKRNKK